MKRPIKTTERARVTRSELRAAYQRLAELDVVQALGAVLCWGIGPDVERRAKHAKR